MTLQDRDARVRSSRWRRLRRPARTNAFNDEDDQWLGSLRKRDLVADWPEHDDEPLGPRVKIAPGSAKPAVALLASDDSYEGDDQLEGDHSETDSASSADAIGMVPAVDSEGQLVGVDGQLATSEPLEDADPAELVSANVMRATLAIEAARQDLEAAATWATKTRALQLNEQQIGQLLIAAQRASDKAVAQAEARAREIVSAAEAHARTIVASAEARAEEIAAASAMHLVAGAPQLPTARDDVAAVVPLSLTSADATDLHDVLASFSRTNAELASEIVSLMHSLVIADGDGSPSSEG